MSNASSGAGDIFDVKRIRRLVELMNEHELGEIDLRDGAVRIRLRKHGEPVVTTYEARPQMMAPAAESRPSAAPAAEAKSDANLAVITSDMVGTFYTAVNPESPPFVKVGDHVGADSTVCIIEAMKVFNEMPAGVAGKIVAILVDNGQPVEFGQPLFKVDTRQ